MVEKIVGVGETELRRTAGLGGWQGIPMVPHNSYLAEAVGFGTIGLLLFLTLHGLLFREFRRLSDPWRGLGLGLLSAIAVFAFVQSFDYPVQISLLALPFLARDTVRRHTTVALPPAGSSQ